MVSKPENVRAPSEPPAAPDMRDGETSVSDVPAELKVSAKAAEKNAQVHRQAGAHVAEGRAAACAVPTSVIGVDGAVLRGVDRTAQGGDADDLEVRVVDGDKAVGRARAAGVGAEDQGVAGRARAAVEVAGRDGLNLCRRHGADVEAVGTRAALEGAENGIAGQQAGPRPCMAPVIVTPPVCVVASIVVTLVKWSRSASPHSVTAPAPATLILVVDRMPLVGVGQGA